MPDWFASLPISGVDGTLKRSKAQAVAHLKTGSLRDVAGIADCGGTLAAVVACGATAITRLSKDASTIDGNLR